MPSSNFSREGEPPVTQSESESRLHSAEPLADLSNRSWSRLKSLLGTAWLRHATDAALLRLAEIIPH